MTGEREKSEREKKKAMFAHRHTEQSEGYRSSKMAKHIVKGKKFVQWGVINDLQLYRNRIN